MSKRWSYNVTFQLNSVECTWKNQRKLQRGNLWWQWKVPYSGENLEGANFCMNGHKAFRINFHFLIFVQVLARIMPHPYIWCELGIFPFKLMLPCDAFHTASLASLYNGCRANMCGQGLLGSGRTLKAGNSDTMPSLYLRFYTRACSFKTAGHHAKCTEVCTDPKFPAIRYSFVV